MLNLQVCKIPYGKQVESLIAYSRICCLIWMWQRLKRLFTKSWHGRKASTMVDIELIGGPMDGAILHRTTSPDRITLKNPNPLTYHSKLCAPLVLKQVTYVFSHFIVGDKPKMFYVFEGHIE